jgi:hypothetical protein
MKLCVRIVFILCLCFTASVAQAQTKLCYQGQDFTTGVGAFTTSDSVSGCVTLSLSESAFNSLTDGSDAVLNSYVTSYSFSDGVDKIKTGSLDFYLQLQTNGSGTIDDWYMFSSSSGSVYLLAYLSIAGAEDLGVASQSFGVNQDLPGTWTVSNASATPEPPSYTLMLGGVLLLLLGTRLRR